MTTSLEFYWFLIFFLDKIYIPVSSENKCKNIKNLIHIRKCLKPPHLPSLSCDTEFSLIVDNEGIIKILGAGC